MNEELEDELPTCDLPEHGLARGDIGTVMLVDRGGKGYEVEFTTLDGETVAIVALMANQVRPCKLFDEECRKRGVKSIMSSF